MDDLIVEFLSECFENLTVLDGELVRLERDPGDRELLAGIFRIVHTIKGTSGFLGLSRLERLTHAAESVLGRFRDGELRPNADAVTVILATLDRIKLILTGLREAGKEPAGDDDDLIARLETVGRGEKRPASAKSSKQAHSPPPARAPEPDPAPVESVPEPPAQDAPKPTAGPAMGAEPAGRQPSVANAAATLRVPVEVLEKLMTLVGELVLTRNQLVQRARQADDHELGSTLQRLSQITSELQDNVMRTRMQPIGNAWSQLPRLVRDLGLELGKPLNLEMRGAETELDRQVLELIRDPLTHMVRNSADHGIEPLAERRAAAKPDAGTIRLEAFHEGGHIILRVGDDGRGLDPARIGAKAVASGLVTEAELATLPTQQVLQFIFRPGFSTAARVTNVSGRGVGLDVVRSNVERIGGSIELSATPGQGTIFTIKIPLTLAIVPALLVRAGGERFAVPQIGVVELVRAGPGQEHRIELVGGTLSLRLRERLLPLLHLASTLGLSSARDAVAVPERAFVVVAQVGSARFGLLVDEVLDTEEIVVKPLARKLRGVRTFSGNTILGDGSVVMILDLNAFARGAVDRSRDAGTRATGSRRQDGTSLLLFRAGIGAPKAVPLALVTRLEQVEAAAIEWSGGRTVIQYRGGLMPVIEQSGRPAQPWEGTRPMLVFSDSGRHLGLVVDEIVDIVESQITMELRGDDAATLGSAVIAGKSTDLLDVARLINAVFGGWFTEPVTQPFDATSLSGSRRVLVVDDSAFFRGMLTPILESSGFVVTTAGSPAEALAMRARGERFDAIVSDIEMPEMDGFAFAREVRSGGAWATTPIIALTSHTAPEDLARGREAGFDDYVGKLDRQSLVQALTSAGQPVAEAA
jgi:two-component system chemotaxis sensor kinase CheA